jgi:FAD:protein FMN transferase
MHSKRGIACGAMGLVRREIVKLINIARILAISIALLLTSACGEEKREQIIAGRTMGTTYHVKVVTGSFQSIAGLKEKIDARLVQINGSMSTYQPDSEISRFNDLKQAGRAFEVSADFLRVMMTAKTIFELSGGAWDATVNPLVELWGFGPAERQRAAPPKKKIAALLPKIGFENIQILPNGTLVKKNKFVTLDLSSIAKGYGVDQVAQIIQKSGFNNYLVEIGGEIFASGHREDGKLWRIGINRPRKDAAFDDVYQIVDLNNQGFATSGDYRNFFEVDGIRYSHVIDPRTGYPVSNGIVSVSIVADNCTLADGLATAVMVMGTEKGLDLINRLQGVEGLIIIEKPNGSLGTYYSKRFEVVQ